LKNSGSDEAGPRRDKTSLKITTIIVFRPMEFYNEEKNGKERLLQKPCLVSILLWFRVPSTTNIVLVKKSPRDQGNRVPPHDPSPPARVG
jgi:hypothetical protein